MEQEKLKSLLGDAYKDGMTDDEAIETLSQLRSDEQTRHAKEKLSFDKTSKELADLKKKNGEKLTEEEKRNEYIGKLETENANLKKEKAISELCSQYIELGYEPKLAKETAEAYVENNTQKVFENQKAFLKAKEESMKSSILKKTPRPKPDEDPSDDTITKEQFNKMSLSERTELYQNNPELYAQLKGGN